MCDKKTTFCNSYVSSLTIFLKQHSANRSLRQLRKNLDSCKLKLSRSAGQDNHRISDRVVSSFESLAVRMSSCCIFGPELQIDTLVGPAVRHSALPRERFSPLTQSGLRLRPPRMPAPLATRAVCV